MCSLKGFILVSEWLWNDFSYVFLNGFYPRLWEVMEWFLVCVPKWFLSSPLRGYGMISHMCSLKGFILASQGFGMISCMRSLKGFILVSQRLWNYFLYVIFQRFDPRLSEVMEWFLICMCSLKGLSSSLRGYGIISHMCSLKGFILASQRLWKWFQICVL